MKFTSAILASLLLISCSNKPELQLIINDALDYQLTESYEVLGHTQSPKLLNIMASYNATYSLKLSPKDYRNLINRADKSWKLQPSSLNDYKRWEHIAKIRQYGLISVSSFDNKSRVIDVHISE